MVKNKIPCKEANDQIHQKLIEEFNSHQKLEANEKQKEFNFESGHEQIKIHMQSHSPKDFEEFFEII